VSIDLRGLRDAVSSVLRAEVAAEGFTDYEPEAAPGGQGLTMAAWLQSVMPVRGGHGLDSTTLRLEMQVRFYYPAGVKAQEQADTVIMQAVDAVGRAVSGAFTLGGDVMNVDLLGQYGEGFGGRAGYTAIDGAEYRIFTLILPLILPDMWPQTP
jgi:hypothetical protein